VEKRRSVVPLNSVNEAFELFNELLVPSVTHVRGEIILPPANQERATDMESQRLEVVYYRAKDCLYLETSPDTSTARRCLSAGLSAAVPALRHRVAR
jgi:hypothetical protein